MKRKNKTRVVHREPEEVYFEIYDPSTLRKQILTSAIEVVDTLKEYEVSKELRPKKEKQIRQLKSALLHIKSNFRSLRATLPIIPKDALPKPEKRHVINKETKIEPIKQREIVSQNRQSQESSTVRRLENELSQIRNKLNSL